MAMPEQQLNALQQQVQALTQGQEQQNAALHQMRQEKEARRAELSAGTIIGQRVAPPAT